MTNAAIRKAVLAALAAAPGGLTKPELEAAIGARRDFLAGLRLDNVLDSLRFGGTVVEDLRPGKTRRTDTPILRLANAPIPAPEAQTDAPVLAEPTPPVRPPEADPRPAQGAPARHGAAVGDGTPRRVTWAYGGRPLARPSGRPNPRCPECGAPIEGLPALVSGALAFHVPCLMERNRRAVARREAS